MSNPIVNVSVSGPKEPSATYKTKVLKGSLPFSSQVGDDDTKYVIKFDFDLGGGSVTIPTGCLLEFDGGSLSNGTIVLNDCAVLPTFDVLAVSNLTVSGMPKAGTIKWDADNGKPLWSNGTDWVDATGATV